MSRLLSISLKDITVWLRDPAALGVLLGMPIILILILGAAFGGLGGGGDFSAHVAIVNLDEGASAASATPPGGSTRIGDEIVSALTDNEDLAGLFEIEQRDDAEAVRTEVERGDLIAALIVPADFTERINAGEAVDLEVLRDPGSELSSGIWESVIRSIATEFSRISVIAQTSGQVSADAGLPPEALQGAIGLAVQAASAEDVASPVEVKAADAVREEGEISPLDFFSLSMTSMFLMFGAMFGAFSFITERREQTMSRLLTTPTTRSSVVGGKMLGIFLLGMLQFGVLFAYTSGMMKVNWGASVAGTWMIAAAEMAATTGLAVLIASIAKTERGAGGIGPLVIQVMALIGGAFFQISVLPEWLQPIRYASVIGWALEGFQKVQTGGAGPADLLGEVGALFAFAVVFFGVGVWRLRDAR
ncbi:MAG: ABC-2 transporter permease [Actinomycetota bacterium]|nr:ABC-2 transporter permease [Actinomycetota bacterium]